MRSGRSTIEPSLKVTAKLLAIPITNEKTRQLPAVYAPTNGSRKTRASRFKPKFLHGGDGFIRVMGAATERIGETADPPTENIFKTCFTARNLLFLRIQRDRSEHRMAFCMR